MDRQALAVCIKIGDRLIYNVPNMPPRSGAEAQIVETALAIITHVGTPTKRLDLKDRCPSDLKPNRPLKDY
jgi:hypothetical protein